MDSKPSQLKLVIAVGVSKSSPENPKRRVKHYHADTAEVTTTWWPRDKIDTEYFEGCNYPTVDDLASQAYTVMAYTKENYYLAVNIRGETAWLSRDEILNRSMLFTNISLANQEIIKHGWISTQKPTDIDITPIIHFKKCLSRVSTLANGNIGTYMFCPNGDIILKSASRVSSENLIMLPGVTKIKAKALQFNNSIRHITLPSSITKIEPGAFTKCESLEEINIPTGITEIGEQTFYSCTALHKINIPEGVTTIGRVAFANCHGLEHIDFPSSLRVIAEGAFSNCQSLEEVKINQCLTRIHAGAFKECISLKKVELPDSLTHLAQSIFTACTSLESIKLPSKLEAIPYKAFSGCTKLSEITIPSSCKQIDEIAFRWCDGLKNIYLIGPSGSISGAPWGAPSECQVHWAEPGKPER